MLAASWLLLCIILQCFVDDGMADLSELLLRVQSQSKFGRCLRASRSVAAYLVKVAGREWCEHFCAHLLIKRVVDRLQRHDEFRALAPLRRAESNQTSKVDLALHQFFIVALSSELRWLQRCIHDMLVCNWVDEGEAGKVVVFIEEDGSDDKLVHLDQIIVVPHALEVMPVVLRLDRT